MKYIFLLFSIIFNLKLRNLNGDDKAAVKQQLKDKLFEIFINKETKYKHKYNNSNLNFDITGYMSYIKNGYLIYFDMRYDNYSLEDLIKLKD